MKVSRIRRKKTKKERLDKYYHLAKEQGFRARSAFKLIQLARKYNLFDDCRVVVDLCAAPGGWLQVCARNMPVSSLVIGVDLMPIQPIKGCIAIREDITTQRCKARLKELLGGNEVDLFLHDGSPNVGSDWSVDAFNQNTLVLHALSLASAYLRKGGIFVTKVFRSVDYLSLLYVFNRLFKRVDSTKPTASRSVSAEIFVVCLNYLKPDFVDPKLFDPKYAFNAVEDENDLMRKGKEAESERLENRAATGKCGKALAADSERDAAASGGELVERKAEQREEGGEGLKKREGEMEGERKKGSKLSDAWRALSKRRRSGYNEEEMRYKVVLVREFFQTETPVDLLMHAYELRAYSEVDKSKCSYTERVLNHKKTTESVRNLWLDLKVLGKREMSDLLKWRYIVKRDLDREDRERRREEEENRAGEDRENRGKEEGEKRGEEERERGADGEEGGATQVDLSQDEDDKVDKVRLSVF